MIQEVQARQPAKGSAGMISKSLDAGLEIEKSRLNRDFNPEVIKEFGRLLKYKAIRTTGEGRKRFSDPAYAAPLRNMYFVVKGGNSIGTTDEVLSYWEEFAESLAGFDASLDAEKKTELVKLCADLHQFLSDELRNHEELGYYGWWN